MSLSEFFAAIRDRKDRETNLVVFSSKTGALRCVKITPREWGGKGLLGSTIRFDAYDSQDNEDFLLGAEGVLFRDLDDLCELVQKFKVWWSQVRIPDPLKLQEKHKRRTSERSVGGGDPWSVSEGSRNIRYPGSPSARNNPNHIVVAEDKSSTGLIGQNYAVLMEQERSSKGAVAGANGDQDRPADVVPSSLAS
eukprot:g13839.t1